MAHPGGRPTKYTDDLPEKLIQAMYNGMSVERFCRQIRISKDTFYSWVKERKEFSDAFNLGRSDCEAFWEEWLVDRLESKNVNVVLVKMLFAQRFGWYESKQNQEEKNSVKDEFNEELKLLISKYQREI